MSCRRGRRHCSQPEESPNPIQRDRLHAAAAAAAAAAANSVYSID